MALPPAAQAFYREQRRLAARVLGPAAALWGDRPPADFDVWFAQHADDLVATLIAAQNEAVSQALDYVPAVLAEQNATVTPDLDPNPAALVGVAGDGRPLRSLLYGAVITAKGAIARGSRVTMLDGSPVPGFETRAWADSGRAALLTRMQTVLADTSRVATGLGIAARPRTVYVRMLVGSSCSRCVVLAGREYGSIVAFDRHPGCDCRHIPKAEDRGRVRATDPRAFFESLTTAEQDRTFTIAGAQAIRDGADIAQVVNARRGAAGLETAAGRVTAEERAAIRGRDGLGRLMRTELPGGRQLATTTEGVTRRGVAYRAMGTRQSKRLMPEAIYEVADDRDDALRMLQRFGYLDEQPTPATAGGGGGGVPPTARPPRVAAGGGDPQRDRLDVVYQRWSRELTARQRDSVRLWQGTDRYYQAVQRAATGDQSDSRALRVADDLVDIAATGRLPEAVSVWRGVRSSSATFGVSADELESVVGREEQLDRFFATTTNPDVARSEFTRPANASGAVLMRVTVAAGTRAAWISAVGDPTLREQAELLIPFGVRRRIVGVDRSGDTPIVDVEVSEQ